MFVLRGASDAGRATLLLHALGRARLGALGRLQLARHAAAFPPPWSLRGLFLAAFSLARCRLIGRARQKPT
eukprot:3164231-Alexandrium_andersonii.AAC.1